MSPALERLDLERAWQRLQTHLAWADEFWLAFVFTDDPRVSKSLRERCALAMDLKLWRCSAPEEVDVMLAELIDGELGELNWIEFVRSDDYRGRPGWAAAWERVLLRLNERREQLRRRAPKGGFVFATTVERLDSSPAAAPDLWTVRSFVLVVEGMPRATTGYAKLERRRIAQAPSRRIHPDPRLARQAVEAARERGDASALARALSSLAYASAEEEAVTHRREAIELYRESLDTAPSPTTRRALAAELNALGNELASLGRTGLALSAARESVEHARALAGTGEALAIDDLATSLLGLCARLGEAGREREGLAVIEEAVELRRALVQAEVEEPEMASLGLAVALINLSSTQLQLDALPDATHSSAEALSLLRELAEHRPDIVLTELFKALVNYGGALVKSGKPEQGLSAIHEAADIAAELDKTHPDEFLPEIAMMSFNFVALGLSRGRGEELLDVAQSTVANLRRLADTRPDAFSLSLAEALTMVGTCALLAGQTEQADEATREAVDLLRRLIKTTPASTPLPLAQALAMRGQVMLAMGEAEAATTTLAESCRLALGLAKVHPDVVATLLETIARAYQAACEATGISPAEDLRPTLDALELSTNPPHHS